MRVRLLLLIVVIVTGLVSSAYAPSLRAASPEPTGFRNVTLWVNPEYDDPRLLVMLEGIVAGVDLPAQVRFPVPSTALMFSAGSKDAQGNYTGGPPARTPSSIPGWDEISYTVTADTFRVEYYDPGATTGQPDKQISYDFRWLYPISDLRVVIQRPRTASNFKVTPQGLVGTDNDGLAVQTYSYQNLDVDQSPLHFEIAYTKADTSVSVSNPPLSSTDSTGSPNVPLILGVLGGIVVLAGAMWILNSMKTSKHPARYAPGRRTTVKTGGKRPASRYCRNCGKPVDSADKFCPYCGSRIS